MSDPTQPSAANGAAVHNAISNAEFLEVIFGNLIKGSTPVVCAFEEPPEQREKDGSGWPVRVPLGEGQMATLIARGECNAYFCVSAVRVQAELHRRAEDFVALHVVVLDDVGTGVGSKVAPENVPLEPTYNNETSLDNHQYGYVLAEPITDRDEAVKLIRCVTKNADADQGGMMAAKLVRLPVGYNNKPARLNADGTPFKTRLVEWHPEHRFTKLELMAAFGITQADLDAAPGAGGSGTAPLADDAAKATPRGQALIRLGLLDANARSDSSSFFNIRCPWWEAHTDSPYARWIAPSGFMCHHHHCKERKSVDFIAWIDAKQETVAAEGTVAWMEEHFVYSTNGYGEIIDLRQPWLPPVRKTAWMTAMSHFETVSVAGKKVTRTPNATMFLKSPKRRVVTGETWVPEGAPLIDGKVNTYRSFRDLHEGVTPNVDGLLLFLGHMKYLVPDARERKLFVDWMARVVQYPALRPTWVLLHISIEQGTGRGWLNKVMAKLLRAELVSEPKTEDIVGKKKLPWGDWAYQKLWVSIPEVYLPGDARYTATEAMKEMLEAKTWRFNLKYGGSVEGPLHAFMLLQSNHRNAAHVPDHDRRFCVITGPEKPKEDRYYQELYAALERPQYMRAIYDYLMELDLTEHFSYARAPKTQAKADMADYSKSTVELRFNEAMEVLQAAPGAHAVIVKTITDFCLARQGLQMLVEVDDAQVKALMTNAGMLPHGKQLRFPKLGVGARGYVRVMPNAVAEYQRRKKSGDPLLTDWLREGAAAAELALKSLTD